MSELSMQENHVEAGRSAASEEASPSSTVFDYLWYFWAWQPCTFRGLFSIILATAAVRSLAIAEFDLVATILGWSILFLSAITFIAVVFLRFRLSGRLDATAHFSTAAVVSGRPIQGGLAVRNSSLPPFFTLEIRRVFAHAGVNSPAHFVSGYQSPESPRILVDAIVFPHRGLWELRSLECRISDALGFCALRWRLPLQHRIQVSAEDIPISPLPIVASSHRTGEDLSTSMDRTGDLFDIKAYDPSDGIKRILWKTYARSGQLVSRRPEPAAIPDGEIAIFLVATRTDDPVAGALQSYLEQLRDNDIEVLFGADTLAPGSRDRLSSTGYLSRRAEIQEAIDGDVWQASAGSGLGFSGFLEALNARGRSLDQVVVFVSAANEEWIPEITRGLEKITTRVVVAAVDVEQLSELGYRSGENAEKPSLPRRSAGMKSGSRVDRITRRLSGSNSFEVIPVRASIKIY